MFGEQTLAQFSISNRRPQWQPFRESVKAVISKVHPFSYNGKVVISVQDQTGKCLCVTEEADTVMQSRMISHSSSVWTERIELTDW